MRSLVSLGTDDIGLLIIILRHGYVRDLHPNYRANASAETLAILDCQRADADALLERLETSVGLR